MKQRPKLLITSDEKRGFDVSRIRNTPLKKGSITPSEKRGFGVSKIRNTPLKEKGLKNKKHTLERKWT
jgi:hypothetical protein